MWLANAKYPIASFDASIRELKIFLICYGDDSQVNLDSLSQSNLQIYNFLKLHGWTHLKNKLLKLAIVV